MANLGAMCPGLTIRTKIADSESRKFESEIHGYLLKLFILIDGNI